MADSDRPPARRRDPRDLGGTLSEGGRVGDDADDRDRLRRLRDPRMLGGGGGVERDRRRDARPNRRG
jgi:hypothetical protein